MNFKTVFALALLFSFLFSFSCRFVYNPVHDPKNGSEINASISTSIAVQGPANAVCAGSPANITVRPSHSWDFLGAVLVSHVTGSDCLQSNSKVPSNSPIHWLNSQKFSLIDYEKGSNTYAANFEAFSNFITTNSIPYSPSSAGSRYLKPGGGIFDGTFNSDIGIYCKGKLRLVSTTPGYSYMEEKEYSLPSATTFGQANFSMPMPSGLQNLKFKAYFIVEGCVATGRTYTYASSPNYCQNSPDAVWFYGRCAGMPRTFESNEITVPIENPFSCSKLPLEAALNETNPAANSEVMFYLNITNNLSKEIRILNISLASSSIEQGFAQVSQFSPISVTLAPLSKREFSAKIRMPPSEGQKQIKLNITYQPTTPDCSGARPQCNLTEIEALTVVVGPGQPIGPDYNITRLVFDPSIVSYGRKTLLEIHITNIGNRNATNVTYTSVQNCDISIIPLRPLNVGESAVQQVYCSCVQPGQISVEAEANYNKAQYEIDYSNNRKSGQFICTAGWVPTCADYV
ncbi:MAG: hypothetical protein QXN37_03305 [Candidatus Anstonellaceae archaeon]